MHRAIVAAVFTAWFTCVPASHAEKTSFQLASNGRASAVIVAEPGTNGYAYAANELTKYLGKITGAAFMVADRPVRGYKTIRVGTPYKASRPEELCVRVKNRDTLEFTGDGPLGTLYAVYDFLETQGVVFSANDYEYLPCIPDLAIPADYAKTDAPCMTWRDIWGVISFDTPYALKLRLHIDKKSLFRGTDTRPPACACPHADRLEPV
jgi:hypothetical protein